MHRNSSTIGPGEARSSPSGETVASDHHGHSDAGVAAALPRCGRCVWWMGHRSRNVKDKTVSFAINGRCSNMNAPADLAGRQVYFLDGSTCHAFRHWKSP
jgi:hypothetical protein